jgi:hypothetical protein
MSEGAPLAAMPGAIRVTVPGYMARAQWRLRTRLPMWVVYRPGTREYPHHWVARMHVALPAPKPTRFIMAHAALPGLHDMLVQLGLIRFERTPGDVPEIVEVWL